jgi:protein involved in polysaccharide export with SLBB domain
MLQVFIKPFTSVLLASLPYFFLFACGVDNRIKENIPNVAEKTKVEDFAIDVPDKKLYLIASGDQIRIEVFARSNLKPILPVNDFTIQENGFITVPLLGVIYVEGSTLPEIKNKIYNKLSETMVEPIIHVTITQRTQQKVLVAGEVKNPGIYPLGNITSALEAILLAGGFSQNADKSLVVLIRTRPKNEGEKNETYAFSMNIDQYLKEKNFDQNVILKRGDILYVPDDYIARSGRIVSNISTLIRPFVQTFGVISGIYLIKKADQ